MKLSLKSLYAGVAGAFGAFAASLGAAQTPEPAAPAPPPIPFADEIARFGAQDLVTPPPPCPVLFVGSSSIRLWASLAQDMAPLPVLNRGFGGARIADVNQWFEEVVTRYHPRAIAFYAGENDLDSGRPPEAVIADFERFMELKAERLGATPVHFISIKPSRARFRQITAQGVVNAAVRTLSEHREDLDFVDVAGAMLQDGSLRDIYVDDGLHLNPAGYSLWTQIIGDAVRSNADQEALACGAPPAFPVSAPPAPTDPAAS